MEKIRLIEYEDYFYNEEPTTRRRQRILRELKSIARRYGIKIEVAQYFDQKNEIISYAYNPEEFGS